MCFHGDAFLISPTAYPWEKNTQSVSSCNALKHIWKCVSVCVWWCFCLLHHFYHSKVWWTVNPWKDPSVCLSVSHCWMWRFRVLVSVQHQPQYFLVPQRCLSGLRGSLRHLSFAVLTFLTQGNTWKSHITVGGIFRHCNYHLLEDKFTAVFSRAVKCERATAVNVRLKSSYRNHFLCHIYRDACFASSKEHFNHRREEIRQDT